MPSQAELTPSYIADHVDDVTLENKLKQDKFKNNKIGTKIENQELVFENDVHSPFGISQFTDDTGKVSHTFKVYLDQNPDMKLLGDALDPRLVTLLNENKDLCFPGNDMISPAFIKRIFKGVVRRPKDDKSFEKYGYTITASIGEGTIFHKTTKHFNSNGKRLAVAVPMEELIGTKENKFKSKGTYTITFSIPHIQLKEMACSAVVYAQKVCFHSHLSKAESSYNNLDVVSPEEIAVLEQAAASAAPPPPTGSSEPQSES